MADPVYILKSVLTLSKKKKEKHNKALSFILWKKKPFFKKREKIRPQKQLKDYNVTEEELWIINGLYLWF